MGSRPVPAHLSRRTTCAGTQAFQGRVGQPQGLAALGEAGERLGPIRDAVDEMVDLGVVGLAIALDEEVEDRIAGPGALGTRGDHRRRVPVQRLQHALLAESLDPLVVAVGAAPAVVDVDQCPAGRAQRDHGRVDVADRLDRGSRSGSRPWRAPRRSRRRGSGPCRSRGWSCRERCRPRP